VMASVVGRCRALAAAFIREAVGSDGQCGGDRSWVVVWQNIYHPTVEVSAAKKAGTRRTQHS